jgi:hypothetical protein
VRLRQPADIADRLQALRWWDWDHDTIGNRLDNFRQLPVEEFLGKYER